MLWFCAACLLLTTNVTASPAPPSAFAWRTGFDFPVGKPDTEGFYKSRGYWPNGHLSEETGMAKAAVTATSARRFTPPRAAW